MKLPFKPAATIFDLDGTLLDTEILYTEASQKVLDRFGHTYTLELKRKVMGGDSTRSAQLTIDEFSLPMTPAQYLAAREQHLMKLFPMAQEIEGAGDFLQQLSEEDIVLGLATSSHQHLCDLKIGHRTWREKFAAVVCGNDAALKNGKPAPDIFLLCAERLEVKPSQVIAFEDSRNGVLAAKAAGMTVIAIDSPYTTQADLEDADLVVPDYRALLA